MDIVTIISSVSKIAILAFTITLGVVIFEVFTLMKRNRANQQHDQHVDIPEFDQTAHAEQHFTQLPESKIAPALHQEQGLPKPLLLGIGILTIVLLSGLGVWFYSRYKVKNVNVEKDISPIADTSALPTKKPSVVVTKVPSPTRIPTRIPSVQPTATPSKSSNQNGTVVIVTISPTISAAVISPTLTTKVISPTTSQTPASSSGTTKAGLPVAGAFQTSLLIVVVSVSLIYLALIL